MFVVIFYFNFEDADVFVLQVSNVYIFLQTIGEKKIINSELWHACAGPLVSLPPVGSLVVYFPQGHSEQVRVF